MSRSIPSRTADPKGRVELEPPRNKSQTVCANVVACESDWKPTEPVAPPSEMVMILPLAWHALISEASAWQLARPVPENVPLSVGLQV
jgi:hypothetical protein